MRRDNHQENPEENENGRSYLPPIQFNNFLATEIESEPLLPNPSIPLPTRRSNEANSDVD